MTAVGTELSADNIFGFLRIEPERPFRTLACVTFLPKCMRVF